MLGTKTMHLCISGHIVGHFHNKIKSPQKHLLPKKNLFLAMKMSKSLVVLTLKDFFLQKKREKKKNTHTHKIDKIN